MDVKDLTSFKWATVVANAPLSIQLDGDSQPLALIPDTLVDPLTLSAGDRVRVELSLRKVVVHGVASGVVGVEAGRLEMTAAASAPAGWLLAQGQSLLRSQYPRLFAAIGTAYGAADSTRFNLPDLRGRVPVGQDASQTEFDTRGEKGGEKAVTLSVSAMPSHSHTIRRGTRGSGPAQTMVNVGTIDSGNTNNRYILADGVETLVADNNGGGGAHNNLQPYITINYIIKI